MPPSWLTRHVDDCIGHYRVRWRSNFSAQMYHISRMEHLIQWHYWHRDCCYWKFYHRVRLARCQCKLSPSTVIFVFKYRVHNSSCTCTVCIFHLACEVGVSERKRRALHKISHAAKNVNLNYHQNASHTAEVLCFRKFCLWRVSLRVADAH